MKKRPISVTVIAWILLAINALSLVASVLTMQNPTVQAEMARSTVGLPLQYGMTYLGLTISLVCAVFMLWAANWARYLYAVWGAISLLFGFWVAPEKWLWLLPGVLIYGLIVFFLFRPKAAMYFEDSAS